MAHILSVTDQGNGQVEIVVDIGPTSTVSVVMPLAAYLTVGADVVAEKASDYYARRDRRPRRPA